MFGGPSYHAAYATTTFDHMKISAEELLLKTRLVVAFFKLLLFVPHCSASIRASMIQNIREQSFSLAKDIGSVRCPPTLGSLTHFTRLFCGTDHVEAIWVLPQMISQLVPVVEAVQQEYQTTVGSLEDALKEEFTRIRDEAEAIVLSTVEKTISIYSMPPPRSMNEEVSSPHRTSCAALTHPLVRRDHIETTI